MPRPSGGQGSNQYQTKGASAVAYAGGAQSDVAAAVTEATPSSTTECSECGTPTKRPDGVCRKCRKDLGSGKPSRGSKSSSRRRQRNSQDVDTSAGAVPPEEVRACAYSYIPMGTIAGMRVQIATPDGQYRSCKNAVRTPEEFCHSHGGNPTNSFGGKTVAKATAEAERGELFPPSASHWDQAEMRYEKLQGQITSMLREEPGRFAQMWAVCSSRRRQDGTQRFSSGNQMMVLIQHLTNYKEEHPNAGWEEAFNSAYEKVAQPHLTKDAWERNGRAPLDDAQGVVVVHYRPRAWIEREDGETDEEFQERCRKGKGHMVPHIQYPLDQTSGDHYEQPEDPYNVILPQGHGDADAAYETLMDYAASRDYKVVHVDTPLPGGARGSWNPVTSTITIWNGIGDGDMGARLHTLAHEIGHADLGHGSDDDAERVRPDQEAGAESFAYLTTARFGIDSSERANHYIKTWQQNHNIDMAAVSSGAFMSAAKAADQMFLNVPSFNPADEPAPL